MNLEHIELICKQITEERKNQHKKWGTQYLPLLRGNQIENRSILYTSAMFQKAENNILHKKGNLSFYDILKEEICEAFAESDHDKIREELIQVAAVVVQIIEAIDNDNIKGLEDETI